jgi:hypothetical protein
LSDALPVCEVYRGINIFSRQSNERIEGVVKPQLDRVLAMSDPVELYDIAANPQYSPEARLAAAARCEAAVEIVTARRERGPAIDIDKLRAAVAGLDSRTWESPIFYGSDLDVGPGVLREQPLTEGDD